MPKTTFVGSFPGDAGARTAVPRHVWPCADVSAYGLLAPASCGGGVIHELGQLAVGLEVLPAEALRARLLATERELERVLLPHERREQQVAYPALRAALAPEDPTAPLVHTHHEIQRRTRLLARALTQMSAHGSERDDLPNLRRALFGLHAVLSLHFAQQDELYAQLGSWS